VEVGEVKIVRFDGGVGVLSDAGVIDITEVAGSFDALIAGGTAALAKVKAAAAAGAARSGVKLLAPVTAHPRIFGIGLNYAEHATESKMKTQAVPTVFMKLASSICGPGDDIVLPENSTEPDYEAEFAVVIGEGGFRIAAADWQRHVFGYTIVNDVSARDVQLATSQWTLGKSFPTFTPVGPCVVTADEIADPHALEIALSIDGEELQRSNTRHLIFGVPALIEYISSIVPLEPGDIISTGTPQGVGLGRDPKRWLKPGEEIVITIEGIGELRNRTRAEE
jgi:2-keto-4-pentenoate hydratase/2-oxohepta-3-ene-1,7-dioic acid hydratase in catechol pathway